MRENISEFRVDWILRLNILRDIHRNEISVQKNWSLFSEHFFFTHLQFAWEWSLENHSNNLAWTQSFFVSPLTHERAFARLRQTALGRFYFFDNIESQDSKTTKSCVEISRESLPREDGRRVAISRSTSHIFGIAEWIVFSYIFCEPRRQMNFSLENLSTLSYLFAKKSITQFSIVACTRALTRLFVFYKDTKKSQEKMRKKRKNKDD